MSAVISYSDVLDMIEHTLEDQSIKSLGQILDVVQKYENAYHRNRLSAGKKIKRSFRTRQLLQLIADRLGFQLMKNSPSILAGEYGGILQYNYMDDVTGLNYWKYYLLYFDSNKHTLSIIDNTGHLLNWIECYFYTKSTDYLIVHTADSARMVTSYSYGRFKVDKIEPPSNVPRDCMDAIVVDDFALCDLNTGRILCDLSEYSLSRSIPLILGLNKKENNTGYYVWLHPDNLKHHAKWEIHRLLGNEEENMTRSIERPVILPPALCL